MRSAVFDPFFHSLWHIKGCLGKNSQVIIYKIHYTLKSVSDHFNRLRPKNMIFVHLHFRFIILVLSKMARSQKNILYKINIFQNQYFHFIILFVPLLIDLFEKKTFFAFDSCSTLFEKNRLCPRGNLNWKDSQNRISF